MILKGKIMELEILPQKNRWPKIIERKNFGPKIFQKKPTRQKFLTKILGEKNSFKNLGRKFFFKKIFLGCALTQPLLLM